MRRHRRIPLQVEIRARDTEGTGVLLFESADVSAGGTFLKSDLLLEQGEALSLEFRIPRLERLMRAEARVVWVRRFPADGENAGMGVEFLSMSDLDRAALADHLSGELGEGAT